MIHLDTNLLVDLVTVGSPGGRLIAHWLNRGMRIGASAVAWSEFCSGPLTRSQKDSAFAVLNREVHDFTWRTAEQAARLFNLSGRKRGSHADCMIAATAMQRGASLATFNTLDFIRLAAFGVVLEPTDLAVS